MKLRNLFAAVALLALGVFVVRHGWHAMEASRPNNMPASARFVQTGYDVDHNERLGQWVACRPSADKTADWCRVTNETGTVVYEGDFLPVDSPRPVAASGLAIGTLDAHRLWTQSPSQLTPVPVIPLRDGQVLVPVDDRTALIERWAADRRASDQYLHPGT